MKRPDTLRWLAFGVFVISSTLSFLDRQLIATLAPLIMSDLRFNQTGFGFLISAFSITYAISSPIAGWFLDRVGINRGISAAVSWWSAAAVSTGFTRALGSLTVCRAALGLGESAGVPAAGKLNGIYLKPEERALGAAVNQIGISLGLTLAPLWISVARAHTWRTPFVITGLFGFAWLPIWLTTSRLIPPQFGSSESRRSSREHPGFSLLRDRALLTVVVANVLWMGSYSLWSNWTTLYLTRVHRLTLQESAKYVWIPPLISNLGGFFGGWMSLKWMKRGIAAIPARQKAVWASALGSLMTLSLPLAPDARWATAVISISFFFALAGSVNIYALPIDLFGPARSGLAVAALTCAYGLLQTVISPLIGYLSDHALYNQVIWLVTLPPILSALVLMAIRGQPVNVRST
ncbi:MAG: MFS transporter [Acidobacteriaceae bacterium]|nr:MFS transporter [Acidobacteriaceae bacterium]MBV9780857.1 MFS transporter [Acidobacteriaceae bacterium]